MYYSDGYESAAAAAGVRSTEDVKKLQVQLNSQGAGLEVDGIYGPETNAAYESYGAMTESAPEAAYSAGIGSAAEKMVYYAQGYIPSGAVQDAEKAYLAMLGEKPEAFTSQYDEALEALYDSMQGMGEFSYDLNGDALYRQYRDSYLRQGRLAMEDTMGQAAALTGGYGNTYAETAGSQAYDEYLQKLGYRIPELYELALERYQMQGAQLQDRFETLYGLRQDEFDAYRSAYDAWESQVEQSRAWWESLREADYETWSDALDYWTDRADAEQEAVQAAAGGSGSSGSGSGGKQSSSTETGGDSFGRYARAIDREFTENAYGRFDLYEARREYLTYYRDQGLITQKEYRALLDGNYGSGRA